MKDLSAFEGSGKLFCRGGYSSSHLHKISVGGQFSKKTQLSKDLLDPLKLFQFEVWVSEGSFIARKTNKLTKKILCDQNKL